MPKAPLPPRLLFRSNKPSPETQAAVVKAASRGLRETNKIIIGLKEAVSVAKGEAKPVRVHQFRGAVRGELIGVRLQPDMLERLDDMRGERSRPEAIRAILGKHLA